jgi:hypothetical protein
LLACLILIASAASFPHPRDISGAPLLADAEVSPQVLAILRRSCGDCHSEATRYPWYSYVAPASWLVQRDVGEGKGHLNLSRWSDYSLVRKQRLLSEIANQVEEREMPLLSYTMLHPDARLSASEVRAIFEWTQTERNRLIAGL